MYKHNKLFNRNNLWKHKNVSNMSPIQTISTHTYSQIHVTLVLLLTFVFCVYFFILSIPCPNMAMKSIPLTYTCVSYIQEDKNKLTE